MTMREKPVEAHLLKQARHHGMLCVKFVSPARSGVPDRVLVTTSKTVFVEVKRPGEDLSELQRATHEHMRKRGAEIYVVDDYASIDRLIHQLDENDAATGIAS